MRPRLNSFPPYFGTYINLVAENDVITALTRHGEQAQSLLNRVNEEASFYKYTDNKWTVKEVLQHVIDAERIFAYRALCIARRDTTTLPGFDEKMYAMNAPANQRQWTDIVSEFVDIRKTSIHLFTSFDKSNLPLTGTISDYRMSVLALGYTIAGHGTHHINIIRERYLAL